MKEKGGNCEGFVASAKKKSLSFHRMTFALHTIEVLSGDGSSIALYDEKKLMSHLSQRFVTEKNEDVRVLSSSKYARLFVMMTFENKTKIPEKIFHRITVKLDRGNGQISFFQTDGAEVFIDSIEPLVIGPPVKSGVWLSANGTGDGPIGHRDSMSVWKGKGSIPQRYAIDLMKFGDDGRLVAGDISKNENWYAHSEELIAVSDGVVVDIKDGITENVPFERSFPNTINYAAGNYLLLDLGKNLFAFYAHELPGSFNVKIGDRVKKGQLLALIGNTGNSDAPHLHFHIIRGNPEFLLVGEGVPFVFESYEYLGPFESLDDNLTETLTAKVEPIIRKNDLPAGDCVIRFKKEDR